MRHLNQIPKHGTPESDRAFADRVLLATDELNDQEAAQKLEQEEQQAQAERDKQEDEDKAYRQVW